MDETHGDVINVTVMGEKWGNHSMCNSSQVRNLHPEETNSEH